MSQQQLAPLSERRFRSVMVVWLSLLLLLLLLLIFFFIVALHFFCFCLFWSSHILTDNIKVMRNLWKKINGDSRRCVRVLGTCKIDVAIDNFSVFFRFFLVYALVVALSWFFCTVNVYFFSVFVRYMLLSVHFYYCHSCYRLWVAVCTQSLLPQLLLIQKWCYCQKKLRIMRECNVVFPNSSDFAPNTQRQRLQLGATNFDLSKYLFFSTLAHEFLSVCMCVFAHNGIFIPNTYERLMYLKQTLLPAFFLMYIFVN